MPASTYLFHIHLHISSFALARRYICSLSTRLGHLAPDQFFHVTFCILVHVSTLRQFDFFTVPFRSFCLI